MTAPLKSPRMNARRHGVLLVAAAALLWSTGGMGIKAVDASPLKVTFYRSLFAAIALMLFLPRNAWLTKRWSSNAVFIGSIVIYAACLTPAPFAVLLFLGVFQIALAYFLFARALAYVTATQASITGMLEPICNPMWVFLFLGERPSPYAIAGAVVVLTAIAWHTLTGEAGYDSLPLD